MKKLLIALALFLTLVPSVFAGNYKSFRVSVYARAYEVEKMADDKYLQESWDLISSQMKVDRIYLETHRDKLIVPQATLDKAKKFFKSKGV